MTCSLRAREDKMATANKYPEVAQSWPEHSCYEWNRQHYVSTPEYLATQCGTCGHITGFKWRRWWPRIVSLFTSVPRNLEPLG